MDARRLWLALAFAACAHAPPSGQRGDFSRFVDEYWSSVYAFSPSAATGTGFHDYDARLEDLSRPRIEHRIGELKGFLSRLQAFDRASLSFDDAVDAQLIENEIRSGLLSFETIRIWERNPMVYATLPGGAVDSLMKREFAPAADRLRAAIARLEQVPAVYAAAKANVKDPPREFTDISIRVARGSTGFFEGSVAEWARSAAGRDAALLARFERANAAAIAAARDFARWLEADLLPRSRGRYAIGPEAFLAKLRHEEMIEVPLGPLLARGEAQLAKDRTAFLETAGQIDAAKPPTQVYASLAQDHPTADDLIPSVRRSVEEARRFVVDHDIVTVPSEVRVKVEETPPYARVGSFASMDTPAPMRRRRRRPSTT